MPNKVIVARFYVPNKTKNVTIQTYDEKKRIMAQYAVDIAELGPTVVYAVSYENQLKAFANKQSWITNK